jgi:transcription antitermination protein NusB
MLGRRHLRTRVLHALYSWYQTENADQGKIEQEMFSGTQRIYDLYLSLLLFLRELTHQENLYLEDVAAKFIVSKQKFSKTYSQIAFIKLLETDAVFNELVGKLKLSWQKDIDIVSKSFFKIRNSDMYKDFTQNAESKVTELDFLNALYAQEIVESDILKSNLEEKSIWWEEGLEYAHIMVKRTFSSAYEKNKLQLIPLFKDAEDDKKFMTDLFRLTIKNDEELKTLISNRTQNWDVERIATMDIILMKMALTEVMQLKNIPVKVSINEYIDLSKIYSTPNSKVFVNGVLDKVVADLKQENKIIKTGRGLIGS